MFALHKGALAEGTALDLSRNKSTASATHLCHCCVTSTSQHIDLQADIVRAITFVDGTGNITRVSRNSNVGRGLVGGLGMLGVITEVTLQLKPGSGKTRSWSPGLRSDANFAQELLQLWVSAVTQSHC